MYNTRILFAQHQKVDVPKRFTDYVNNQFMQRVLKLRFPGGHIHMWTPNDVETYALQIKSKKK
jgi:hypothetical protein